MLQENQTPPTTNLLTILELYKDKQINWEPSFGILLLWTFVFIFPLKTFSLAFRHSSFYIDSLSNSFWDYF